MKVLMLGWELPPHNSGGLGVACHQLCESLSKNDVDIEFVVPYKADHEASFMTVTAALPQSVDTIVKTNGAYDSYKYIYHDGNEQTVDIYQQQLMYEQSIDTVIEDKHYDVIHAHDWLTFRAALRAKESLGLPLILHIHSVESDRAGGHGGNPLVREIERTALHLADHIIAVSELTRQAIIRDYAVPADAVSVVHNSIDSGIFEPVERDNMYGYLQTMKANGYKVIANIGRQTVQKGLTNLLYAAQKVIAKEPKTLFLFVGSGEQYYELLTLSASLGIAKNVLFTGFQRGKAWRDAFTIADLFVMPSVSEPFGLTPLEAIGYGTPSLISKQSGVAEVLQNCLKTDFWDVDEMANQIVSVVRHPSLTETLAQNARNEVLSMSWSDATDKLMSVYRRHVSGAIA